MTIEEYKKMLEASGAKDIRITKKSEKGSISFIWLNDKKLLSQYVEVLEFVVNKQIETYSSCVDSKIVLVWK